MSQVSGRCQPSSGPRGSRKVSEADVLGALEFCLSTIPDVERRMAAQFHSANGWCDREELQSIEGILRSTRGLLRRSLRGKLDNVDRRLAREVLRRVEAILRQFAATRPFGRIHVIDLPTMREVREMRSGCQVVERRVRRHDHARGDPRERGGVRVDRPQPRARQTAALARNGAQALVARPRGPHRGATRRRRRTGSQGEGLSWSTARAALHAHLRRAADRRGSCSTLARRGPRTGHDHRACRQDRRRSPRREHPAVLRDELSDYRAREDIPAEALVFGTATGRPQGATNVRRRVLAKAVKRANVLLTENNAEPLRDGLTPHSLRRTFASLLFAIGETPPYVMAQMGHTTANLTLAIYARQMDRRDGETGRLKALVEGREWAARVGHGGSAFPKGHIAA